MLGFLFGIGSSIILNRLLGPEGKGRFVSLLIVPQLVVAFSHMGYGLSSSYFMGKKRYQEGDVFKSNLLLSIVIGAIGASIGYILYQRFFPEEYLFFKLGLLLLIFTGLWFYYIPDILLGKGRLLIQNYWNLSQQIVKFSLFALFLTIFLNKLKGAVSAVLLLNIVFYIASFFVLSKFISFKGKVNTSYIKDGFLFGHKIFLTELLGFLNYRFDILFLKVFSNTIQIGFYSTATFIAETLWILPRAIYLVLYSKLVTGKISERVTSKVMKNTFFLTLLCAVIALFAVKPLIRLFYTDAFIPSFLPFVILLPGIVFLAIPKVLAAHVVGVWGKPELLLRGRAIAVFVNILLNLFLIPRYGMYGAAFASSLAYIVEAIFFIVIFKGNSGKCNPKTTVRVQ